MLMRQVVYLHFFSYSKHRFWAFTQMQRAHAGLQQCKGLQFYKMLGTGAGAGFSLRPDFSTYALLTVWDTEQCKVKAFDKAAIEITNLKKMISESENKWLELQILHDEINNTQN